MFTAIELQFRIQPRLNGEIGLFLILQNNFGGDLTFSENSNFTFFVADGAQFHIFIKSQPKGKCVVSNGKGTAIADVSNVEVDCWSLVDGVNSSIGINHDSSFNGDGVFLHQFSTKLYLLFSRCDTLPRYYFLDVILFRFACCNHHIIRIW